ncbi:SNARE domain [Carpediemonas membranifera]|uniref:SNARE domain n=1 Tax=Carpediemonas membranifera TaxID=201153 RepID=A0A8J6B356_9EUKA|nr:SNARE domain [Carpediemonas membranifera]|eukprot:KAG9393289.1 SNARE domain [Carpediemonas membranifera]
MRNNASALATDLLPFLLDRPSRDYIPDFPGKEAERLCRECDADMAKLADKLAHGIGEDTKSLATHLKRSSDGLERLKACVVSLQGSHAHRYFDLRYKMCRDTHNTLSRQLFSIQEEDSRRRQATEADATRRGAFADTRIDFDLDSDLNAIVADDQLPEEAVMSLVRQDDLSSQMSAISSQLADVGQLFNSFTGMVALQGEQINLIDSNVSATEHYVDVAENNLQRTLNMVQKNRWLIMKLTIVFFVFALLIAAGKFTHFL